MHSMKQQLLDKLKKYKKQFIIIVLIIVTAIIVICTICFITNALNKKRLQITMDQEALLDSRNWVQLDTELNDKEYDFFTNTGMRNEWEGLHDNKDVQEYAYKYYNEVKEYLLKNHKDVADIEVTDAGKYGDDTLIYYILAKDDDGNATHSGYITFQIIDDEMVVTGDTITFMEVQNDISDILTEKFTEKGLSIDRIESNLAYSEVSDEVPDAESIINNESDRYSIMANIFIDGGFDSVDEAIDKTRSIVKDIDGQYEIVIEDGYKVIDRKSYYVKDGVISE